MGHGDRESFLREVDKKAILIADRNNEQAMVNESGNAMRDAIGADNDDDHDKGEPALCSMTLIITIITIRLSPARGESLVFNAMQDSRAGGRRDAREIPPSRRAQTIRSIDRSNLEPTTSKMNKRRRSRRKISR